MAIPPLTSLQSAQIHEDPEPTSLFSLICAILPPGAFLVLIISAELMTLRHFITLETFSGTPSLIYATQPWTS